MGASADGAEMTTFLAPPWIVSIKIPFPLTYVQKIYFEMNRGLFGDGKDASGLDHVLCPSAGPVDVDRVSLVEDGDFVSIDEEESAIVADVSLEPAVG